MTLAERAVALATAVAAGDRAIPPRRGPWRRRVILGDPQAPLSKLMQVLEANGLLGDDGALRDDVQLLCVGDYFDYSGGGPEATESGIRFLSWLAAHAREQVELLLGNHDAARVMELATLTDERFAEARRRAAELREQHHGPDNERTRNRLFAEEGFTDVPTPGLADRDFASFSVRQRDLVQRLLLEGRLSLAAVERMWDGTELLVTHAGVTTRQLEPLGLPSDAPAGRIAAALEARLALAVEACREPWSRRETVPLVLGELNVAGTAGKEGGGLLHHRPANPDREKIPDRDWEWDPVQPRRLDPRQLPPGLVQACGHTTNRKRDELGPWSRAVADHAPGELRTLTVLGGRVEYTLGIHPPTPGAAVLYLLDAAILEAAPAAYRLLEVAAR